MYEDYWALIERPFENVPDPRFYFATEAHQECLARLSYAVSTKKGATLVIGDVGCGKTLICRKFFSTLRPRDHDIALFINPSLNPTEFLRELLRQWGEEPKTPDKSELLVQIRDRIHRNHSRGVNTLIFIDEAQAIKSAETFEEIRLLLNYQLDDRFLLTVVILGQPEVLPSILSLPQLNQRISIRTRIGPLDWNDTVRYILTRIKRVGAVKCMFTPEALREVFKKSDGVPRQINTLCDLALLRGFLEKSACVEKRHISFEDAQEVSRCA